MKQMVIQALKGDHGEYRTPNPVETSKQAKEMAIQNHNGFKGLTVKDLFARKVKIDKVSRNENTVLAAKKEPEKKAAGVVKTAGNPKVTV